MDRLDCHTYDDPESIVAALVTKSARFGEPACDARPFSLRSEPPRFRTPCHKHTCC